MLPRSADLRTVALIPSGEAVDSWFSVGVTVARPAGLGEAGRPPSGSSRPQTWPRPCSTCGLSPGKWVLGFFAVLGYLLDFWMSLEAFQLV